MINYPECYFEVMVDVHRKLLPPEDTGYVSGFYTPIHPGSDISELGNVSVLLSDSIDGKNIMGPPALFDSVGKLSWYFPDGERRGNPGPTRGSHFDLWQWKFSPNSTRSQDRVNLIIPGLCEGISCSEETSTWNNPGESKENLEKRIAIGRIYKTRKTPVPQLTDKNFFKVEDYLPESKRKAVNSA